MDSLIELPVDKWPVLQEKLKMLWPLNVAGYYAVYLNLKYPRVREAFRFKVYCPYGDVENGFVAITEKTEASQDCIIFSISQDTGRLVQALLETKLINWKNNVCIDLVSSLILNSLEKIRLAMGFSLYDVGLVKTYFLDKKSQPLDDVSYPLSTHLASIKPEHIPHVDELWPYKFPNSVSYFSTLASNDLSYGLYLNDKLVAWVFINEYNFLCHLYCEEEYRQKGYAEFLTKYIVNKQLEIGNDVYAYVCEENTKPQVLFEKLGFVDIDRGAYIFAQK